MPWRASILPSGIPGEVCLQLAKEVSGGGPVHYACPPSTQPAFTIHHFTMRIAIHHPIPLGKGRYHQRCVNWVVRELRVPMHHAAGRFGSGKETGSRG